MTKQCHFNAAKQSIEWQCCSVKSTQFLSFNCKLIVITALLLPELKVASFNCSRLSTCLNFFLRSHALLSISSSSIDNFLIKMRFITYCLFSFECLFLRFQLQLTQRVCCFYHNLVVPQYSSLRSYSIHFKAFLTFFTLKTYSLLD